MLNKLVLITSLYDDQGGAEIVAKSIAEGLAKSGYQVTVVTTAPTPHEESIDYLNRIKIIRIYCPNVYWVGDSRSQPAWKKILWQLIDINNPIVYRKIKNVLAQEKPDIVHVHKLRGFSPCVWKAAKVVGIKKVVQTCHDYELISPVANLAGYVGELFNRSTFVRSAYIYLRRKLSSHVDAVTAPSLYTLNQVTSSGFFERAKIRTVVHNSHGLTLHNLREINSSTMHAINGKTDQISFCYLGRLETIKGIDLLCKAFAELKEELPKIKLTVIGDGLLSQSLRDKYGHEENIIFRGLLKGSEKLNEVRKAHWLVVPSTWPEVFGVVVVEAFAVGTPVICTNVGGLSEIVKEGVNGIIFKSGDYHSIQDAIRNAILQQTNYDAFVQKCFEYAEAFSVETILNDYIAIYDAI